MSSPALESLTTAWVRYYVMNFTGSTSQTGCFFRLAVTVHRCLNGRGPPYLSDYCVPAAGVDTRQHLRSANHQLLAVPRYRLNTYSRRAFSVAGPKVWNFLPVIRDQPSVQTLSDVCLKRTSLLDTSAFSTLEVLDNNHAL